MARLGVTIGFYTTCLFLFAWVTMAMIPARPAPTTSPGVDRKLPQMTATQRAEVALDQGNHELAVELLTDAIEADPTAAAYVLRGRAYERLGADDKAVRDYTDAHNLEPRNPQVLTARAQLHRKLKDYASAIADCTTAIQTGADTLAFLRLRAELYEAAGKPWHAIDDYTVAISIGSEAEDFYMRAWLRTRLKQFAEAIDDCTQIVTRDPAFQPAWELRAHCHFALGRFDNVVSDVKSALRWHHSRSTMAWSLRARAHFQKKEYDLAARDFSSALDIPLEVTFPAVSGIPLLPPPSSSTLFRERAAAWELLGMKTRADEDRRMADQLEAQRPPGP